MISAAAVETLGIGAVFPFMTAAVDPAAMAHNPWLAWLHAAFGRPGEHAFLAALTALLVTLFVAKNAYFFWAMRVQQRFLIRKRVELVTLLFEGYLRSPYAFHLRSNSALLLRNINNVDQVFSGILQPAFVLVTEAIMIAAILLMLAMVEPALTAAAVLLVAVPSFFLHRALKDQLVRIGHANQTLVGRTSKTILEGLNGIKEVIVGGRSDYFVRGLRRDFESLGEVRLQHQMAGVAPRLLLEPVIMLGLLAIVLGLVAINQSKEAILPVLALFGVAAVRVMAAVVRILPGLQQIRFSEAVHEVVVRQLLEFKRDAAATSRPSAVAQAPDFPVTLSDVGFQYPDTKEPVLFGVSLVIPRGAMIGIVGRSGSGKSTLMDLMLGLHQPGSGSVKANGRCIAAFGEAWARWVGYIPQSIYLLDDTLRRNVAFGVADAEIDEAAVQHACRSAQLEDMLRDLPEGLDTVLGERGVRLSGGQRQRVAVARALYHRPELLFLDEATSALDRETEAALSAALRGLAGRIALVIIAHRLRTVADCDELIWLERGRVLDRGRFDELMRRSAAFRQFANLELVAPADAVAGK